jgi:hypothetical protein
MVEDEATMLEPTKSQYVVSSVMVRSRMFLEREEFLKKQGLIIFV